MTIIQLSAWVVVNLGISMDAFYDMTPLEIHHCIEYRVEKQKNENDLFVRTIFESMRLQTMRLLQTNPYVKRKPKKLAQIFQFAWEKPEKQSWQQMLDTFTQLSKSQNKYIKKG